MNKNTRARLREYREYCKKHGWPKFVYKKKVKPFPRSQSRRRLDFRSGDDINVDE